MLRIEDTGLAAHYPQVNRFIMRRSGAASNPAVTSEIQINDIREIGLLNRFNPLNNIRLTGLDDVLCHDYETAFKNIKKQCSGRVEFCPEDSFFCATSTAVEWILWGGADVAVSFGGLGGKAALEELLLALKVIKRHRPGASYSVFPEIKELIEEITGRKFLKRKAVIGSNIFDVESGIHIDGILKKPEMYEPFPPELVGSQRRFFVGKHSGRKAVLLKLKELGLVPEEYDCSLLLSEIRRLSTEKMSSLSDVELFSIAPKYKIK
jgi:homocitrate synthase NifV